MFIGSVNEKSFQVQGRFLPTVEMTVVQHFKNSSHFRNCRHFYSLHHRKKGA